MSHFPIGPQGFRGFFRSATRLPSPQSNLQREIDALASEPHAFVAPGDVGVSKSGKTLVVTFNTPPRISFEYKVKDNQLRISVAGQPDQLFDSLEQFKAHIRRQYVDRIVARAAEPRLPAGFVRAGELPLLEFGEFFGGLGAPAPSGPPTDDAPPPYEPPSGAAAAASAPAHAGYSQFEDLSEAIQRGPRFPVISRDDSTFILRHCPPNTFLIRGAELDPSAIKIDCQSVYGQDFHIAGKVDSDGRFTLGDETFASVAELSQSLKAKLGYTDEHADLVDCAQLGPILYRVPSMDRSGSERALVDRNAIAGDFLFRVSTNNGVRLVLSICEARNPNRFTHVLFDCVTATEVRLSDSRRQPVEFRQLLDQIRRRDFSCFANLAMPKTPDGRDLTQYR